MIFQDTWQRVLSGHKTEMRQTKPLRCAPGSLLTVQPGHRMPAVGRIVVKDVYGQRLSTLTDADIRAEGFEDQDAFIAHCYKVAGMSWHPVTVLNVIVFELAAEDPAAVKRQIAEARQGNPQRRPCGEPQRPEGACDYYLAAVLYHWLRQMIDGGWAAGLDIDTSDISISMFEYTELHMALADGDLLRAYDAVVNLQSSIHNRAVRAGHLSVMDPFRRIWWPQRTECLIWRDVPTAQCPTCNGNNFWRIDNTGYLCRGCLSLSPIKSIDDYTLTTRAENAALPAKIVWRHQGGRPPTYSTHYYDNYLEEELSCTMDGTSAQKLAGHATGC